MTSRQEFATIDQTVMQLHAALQEYIEAAYHISDPQMVKERAALLLEPGVIHQRPYLESTPRYVSGPKYSDISGLDSAVSSLFTSLSKSGSEQDQFSTTLHIFIRRRPSREYSYGTRA